MELTYEELADKLVFLFSGRLDTEGCIEYQNKIEQKVKGTEHAVVFDFQNVTYISSAFLRVCIKTVKEKGPNQFSIINVVPNIKKVFKIAGFDHLMHIR